MDILSVDFAGIHLVSPLIVASGPPTWSGAAMAECSRLGAGAVVTKTIVRHPKQNPCPRIAVHGKGMQNIERYTEHSVEEWGQEIAVAKESGTVVFASLMGDSIDEVVRLAEQLQEYGVDGLELGISCPHADSGRIVGANPDLVFEYTKGLVQHSSVPVMVKLSPNVSDIAEIAMAAEAGGADALSAIDTVRCLLGVDIETAKPLLPTFGGYSGQAIKPIALAHVATIASSVKISVSGIGGILSGDDAIEHMLLGASTFQICTGILLKGFGLIAEINDRVGQYMAKHNYLSVDSFRGKALAHLLEFEEIDKRSVSAVISPEKCLSCGICQACVYGAVKRFDEAFSICRDKCTGCGLCVWLCPAQAIRMEYNISNSIAKS
ncbi:4Fe-4S binding protein [Maridesulfovibrio sp.]|uniref:4Fe-4S binding protein n=1 Tax=Maridesulfovibrio sp. TaxID=2795000 RepID=UPI002A18BAF7|nr:4Fe-4S binding protein [Maridesulfovibrio sp.]